MTQSIIVLLSILAGIIGANLFAKLFKMYAFGITGNTIIGVFGSILFIKLFGRLGFDANAIMESGEANISLLILNITVSLIGGGIAVFIAVKIKNRMDKGKTAG